MIEDFAGQELARSSGELWTEVCSTLPGPHAPPTREVNTEFRDSFQPAAPIGSQVNGLSNGTNTRSEWKAMEDSQIYIASLGTRVIPVSSMNAGIMSHLAHPVHHLNQVV